jgi:hypothetical protein
MSDANAGEATAAPANVTSSLTHTREASFFSSYTALTGLAPMDTGVRQQCSTNPARTSPSTTACMIISAWLGDTPTFLRHLTTSLRRHLRGEENRIPSQNQSPAFPKIGSDGQVSVRGPTRGRSTSPQAWAGRRRHGHFRARFPPGRSADGRR